MNPWNKHSFPVHFRCECLRTSDIIKGSNPPRRHKSNNNNNNSQHNVHLHGSQQQHNTNSGKLQGHFILRGINQYRMQINKKQIVNNHQFARNITQYLFFVTIIVSLVCFIGHHQQHRPLVVLWGFGCRRQRALKAKALQWTEGMAGMRMRPVNGMVDNGEPLKVSILHG